MTNAASTSRRLRPRSRTPGALVWVVLGIVTILVLRFLVADNGLPAIQQRRAEVRTAYGELRAVEDDNRRLKRRIAALDEEDYLVEKMAREELDFAVPGELIYLFPEDLPARR